MEELCQKCQEAKEDLISIKDGKRCMFAYQKKTRHSEDDLVGTGPHSGCSLKVVAKCGHETDVPKYNKGECVGAISCPDYKPESPWWKSW